MKLFRSLFLASLVVILLSSAVWCAVGGSISGTVKDPTGSVIPGVMLTATNTAHGTSFKTMTDASGRYSLPSLPVARYDLTFDLPGFQSQKKTGLTVDSDSAQVINITLELAGVTTEVSVSTTEDVAEVHVETVVTQLGELVTDKKMTTLALNGRSYTDLLPIQPGVTPITTM